MSDNHKIIAVGLLTETDMRRLGPSFTRAFQIDDRPCFVDLLAAIDDAELENKHTPTGATIQG